MKILITTALFLCSLAGYPQERGKLVRNQSVLAMTVQVDTLPLWMVSLTNKNECRSIIEFKIDGHKVDTVTLDKDEDQDMMIHGDFILQFRNATKCEKGSTQWLYIDNILSLPSNPIQNENNWQFNPNSIFDCYIKSLF